jgi:hypothetical protein
MPGTDVTTRSAIGGCQSETIYAREDDLFSLCNCLGRPTETSEDFTGNTNL